MASDPLPPIDWTLVQRVFSGAADPADSPDRPAREPTLAEPGSEAKKSVLALRVRRRLALWHPDDPCNTTAMLTALEHLHDQLVSERATQPNGRSVAPESHTEEQYRDALDEFKKQRAADAGMKIVCEALAARGHMLGAPNATPCPRCRWRHCCFSWRGRPGRFCSWCLLDLDAAAMLDRAHRRRQEQEDAFADAQIDAQEDAE